MVVRIDPAKNEIRALLAIVDFGGRKVLEIGCGDGRLTWRYAAQAAHVTAIDMVEGNIARARENRPNDLKSIVEFQHISFEDFAATNEPSIFDVVILSWSLCCMEHEGMVHALEEIRHLLKSKGALIDIHPFPEASASIVQVYQGNKLLHTEPRRVNDVDEDMLYADNAITNVVERGLYVIERSSKFDFFSRGSSVDEVRTYWDEIEPYEVESRDEEDQAREAAMSARVDEIIGAAGKGTEVAFYERTRITRLKPIRE